MQNEFVVPPISIGVSSQITIQYAPEVLTAYPMLATGRLLIDFKNKPSDTVPVFSMDSVASPSNFAARAPNATGDYIGYLPVSFTIPGTKTALLTLSTIYFDIVAYNGTDPFRIPGRWQWPAIKDITTPRP